MYIYINLYDCPTIDFTVKCMKSQYTCSKFVSQNVTKLLKMLCVVRLHFLQDYTLCDIVHFIKINPTRTIIYHLFLSLKSLYFIHCHWLLLVCLFYPLLSNMCTYHHLEKLCAWCLGLGTL